MLGSDNGYTCADEIAGHFSCYVKIHREYNTTGYSVVFYFGVTIR